MLPGSLIRLSSSRGEPGPDDTLEISENETDEPASIKDPFTVGTFDYFGEAETCRELLDYFGLEAQLARIEGTNAFVPNAADRIAVQVASGDVERARDILEKYQSVQAKRREDHDEEGPITFVCEECGGEISLPAQRRGGVDTCPRCGGYVDVPE
jgi:hypothetical protein